MKKEYMKPAMRVVQVQQKYHLLEGSKVFFGKTMSGSSQMSRQGDDWDDDEEELF